MLSCVWLFVMPWAVANQAPLPLKFSRQEYWSRLPFPAPGDLPDPGIEPTSLALQADSLPLTPPEKPHQQNYNYPPNTCEVKFSWNPTNQDLKLSVFVYLVLGVEGVRRALESTYFKDGRFEQIPSGYYGNSYSLIWSPTLFWIIFSGSNKVNYHKTKIDFLQHSVSLFCEFGCNIFLDIYNFF